MKLWMVLYVSGSVSGVWGPLPYDTTECHERMVAAQNELEDRAKLRGMNVTGWFFGCVTQTDRPQLGEKQS